MAKARKYILKKQYVGEPKRSDVDIVDEELRSLDSGEYLVEALYLSVDPYMRHFTEGLEQADCLEGTQVARVIESKHESFPLGSLVVGDFGWRTHTIVTTEMRKRVPPYILPDLGELPLSLAVGMLGMPGNTVYLAMEEYLKPQSGETILISAAAGAVGSHAGQVAKIKGCIVIGLAGTNVKCEWLVKELGFDYAFNYKTDNLSQMLIQHVPQGIDMYFDNVSVDSITDTVLDHINTYGRIVVVGGIDWYGKEETKLPKVNPVWMKILLKGLSISGFHVWKSSHIGERWQEGINYNLKLLQSGKLKYREHVTQGFDNMFDAFLGMLRGENTGKAILKI